MEYLDDLDDDQKKAVLAPPVPLKVLAGAGSGKTRVIISRIAHQIDTGVVEPGKVFASAFTKAAAVEMSERIESIVSADDLLIGTFHSIMFRTLNEWRTKVGAPRYGVISEYEKKRLIQDLLDHPTKNYPDALNVEVDVGEVISRISAWKNSMIHHDDEEITETIEESPKEIGLGAAARVYGLYESYKSKQNKIDFDDMLLLAYDLFREDLGARKYAQDRWDAFFVDEAQDTNSVQWEILKMIAPPADKPNLTIVGDTRQCLFRFRGAVPELMDGFEQMYKGATTIDLVLNYRSTKQVIAQANSLIKNMMLKDQVPVRGDGPEVNVVPCVDEWDQAKEIASMITAAKEKGYKGGDIATLIRTNAQSMLLERAFVLARHPYWCKGGGFFSHREIADVMAYIRLAVDPSDIAPLYRIINKPTRYLGKAFVEAVERNMERVGGNAVDAMDFTDSYSKRRLSRTQRMEVAKLTGFLRGLARDKHTSRSMIDAIVDDLGYMKWLMKTEGLQVDVDDSRKENIDALKSAAYEYEKPADLVAFADMTDKLQMESGDAVEICTVHRAKGREWPIVAATNFYEGSVPHRMALREGSEPDERRIAYVAFTRAQDLLLVTYPLETEKAGNVSPSRYIFDAKLEGPIEPVTAGWYDDALGNMP